MVECTPINDLQLYMSYWPMTPYDHPGSWHFAYINFGCYGNGQQLIMFVPLSTESPSTLINQVGPPMLHTGIYKSTTTIPTDELQSQQGYFSSMQYIIAPDLAITPGAGTDPTQGNAVQEQAAQDSYLSSVCNIETLGIGLS